MSHPEATPSAPSHYNAQIANQDDIPAAKRPVLSVAEVATILGVDRRVVSRAIAERQVPAVRLGQRWFVPRAALAAFLATTGDEAA
jgi:excisionase family DNA binding protein